MFFSRLCEASFTGRYLRSVRANFFHAFSPFTRFLQGNGKRHASFQRTSWGRAPSRSCSNVQRKVLNDDKGKKGNNIVLMGSPGAGKTTVGRMLGHQMDREVIDVDDDILEKVWGTTVATKLSQVGSEGFVDAEGQALIQYSTSDAVISLSGSNPMHKEAMEHVKSLGDVVYLDVEDDDILNRLAEMKVNRIVGQNEGISMSEILQYRKQFYESNYDIRITCARGDSAEEITNKVLERLKESKHDDGFTSTRNENSDREQSPGFLDVVLEGLAPDGGLYIPKWKIPHLTQGTQTAYGTLSFCFD